MKRRSSPGRYSSGIRTSSGRPSQRRFQGPLAQQMQKGRSGSPLRKNFVEWTLEQAMSAEPVVVVAEAVDAVTSRERCLLGARLRHPQVVEAQIRGQARLFVAGELRSRARDVAPLGEALAPPGVVLRDRIELRQVERDQLRRGHGGRRHGARRDRAQRTRASFPSGVSSGIGDSVNVRSAEQIPHCKCHDPERIHDA